MLINEKIVAVIKILKQYTYSFIGTGTFFIRTLNFELKFRKKIEEKFKKRKERAGEKAICKAKRSKYDILPNVRPTL